MAFEDFESLYSAFEKQLNYVVETKIEVDNYIQRMFAHYAPAPYLSVLIQGCIESGRDYYDGGPTYNSDYIQCCGIGTVTDSLSVLKKHVFEDRTVAMEELLTALGDNWKGHEALRQMVWNRTPFFGNDDDYADAIMQRVYGTLLETIDGRNTPKGPTYQSTCSPPPVISTSARCSARPPTDGSPGLPSRTAHHRSTAQIASAPPRW